MNLLLIILAVFAGLFILTRILDGRAKPMSSEKQGEYARWIMILMAILLVVQGLRYFIK